MAFGINRNELKQWKVKVNRGEIAFLTHFWYDPRFPHHHTVTKAGCSDLDKLMVWGERYELQPEWIHRRSRYPHFDLLGERQKDILERESLESHLTRFRIK